VFPRPRNEAPRQIELPPPRGLGASHPAAVVLVIHAQEMQRSMEHQDFDFLFGGVSECSGLRGGASGGDGDVSQRLLRSPHGVPGTGNAAGKGARVTNSSGEGEDVGGAVLIEEVTVELPQPVIGGKQAGKSSASHFLNQASVEGA